MKNNKMFAGLLIFAAIGVGYWYMRNREVTKVEDAKEETLAATPEMMAGGNVTVKNQEIMQTGGIKQAVSSSIVSENGELMLDKFSVADNYQELKDNF